MIALTGTVGANSASTEPEQPDSLVFIDKLPVPIDNFSRSDEARKAYDAANELYSYHQDLFFGTYYDDAKETAVLLASGDQAREMAEKTFREAGVSVEIRSSMRSYNDLYEPAERILALTPTLTKQIEGWTNNPEAEALTLFVNGEVSESDRAALERAAAELNLRIGLLASNMDFEFTDSRLNDPSPYAGGLRFGDSTSSASTATITGQCTGAFGVYEGSAQYMLTAGHCLPRGSAYDQTWIFSGASYSSATKVQYMGPRHTSVFLDGTGTIRAGDDDGYHGDIAVIKMAAGRAAGTKIFWGTPNTTNKIPVIGHKSAAEGDPVAFNGAVSGSDRGLTVLKTGVNRNIDRMRVWNVDIAISTSKTDCSVKGDSGGSIILDTPGAEDDARAMGVVSASGVGRIDSVTYPCMQLFTGIEEANKAWGVHLKTE